MATLAEQALDNLRAAVAGMKAYVADQFNNGERSTPRSGWEAYDECRYDHALNIEMAAVGYIGLIGSSLD